MPINSNSLNYIALMKTNSSNLTIIYDTNKRNEYVNYITKLHKRNKFPLTRHVNNYKLYSQTNQSD